jgi:hypothetical protein
MTIKVVSRSKACMSSTSQSLEPLTSNPIRGTDAYLIFFDVFVIPCKTGLTMCLFPTKGVLPNIYEHAETGGNGRPWDSLVLHAIQDEAVGTNYMQLGPP